jgi:small GTP-binding protein
MSVFNSNDEEQARKWLETLKEKLQVTQGKKFTFLLVGRTGVGKSSIVNSLMGKTIAVVGDYEPCTMDITKYENELNGINFTIIDTPGLCDDLEEVGNDYEYLERMRSDISQVDSMWFVSRLDETRVTNDEKRGIKLISEAFHSKNWEQAVIIFTFAGAKNASDYPIALEKRTELIRKEIAKYTGMGIANNVPSVAVDNKNERTPDGKKWLGELYTQIYARISAKGATPFFMATVQRVKRPEKEREVIIEKIYEPAPTYTPIELNERQAAVVTNKTAEVLGLASAGASVGAVIGSLAGPVGAAVGGAVGGVIGFIGGLFRW